VGACLSLLGLGLGPAFAQTGTATSTTVGDAGLAPPVATPSPTPKPPKRPPAPRASAMPSAAPSAAASALPAASAEPAASAVASAEPVASASAAPSAEPAPSAVPSAVAVPEPAPSVRPVPSAVAPIKGSPVQLGDDVVFSIRVPRGGKTAAQRAQDATKAFAAAAQDSKVTEVRVQKRDDVAIVLFGQTPIVQLTVADAEAAGDTSLDVHAAAVASAVREAAERERRRAVLAKTVFSISLLVFFGLIVFYLARKVGEFAERARTWVDANAERVLAVRVQKIEVVSPGTVKSTALVGLSVAKWLAQGGIIYTWLLVVLSLFEATRGYTERLTGLVTTPLSQLMTRIATGLPVLAVLAIAGFTVFVLVRFVGLFLQSVERSETTVAWLPPDLAAPTSVLVRVGIVIAALVFLVPLVTGNTEGGLARTGAIIVLALGLSAMPTFASAVLGAIILFGRRLRPGQHVRIGGFAGRITSIGLLDVRLEDRDGVEVRVPHLYALYQPTTVLGIRDALSLDVAVAPTSRLPEVRSLILRTAEGQGDQAWVDVVSVDAERALFRVSVRNDARDARSQLQLAIASALAREGIALGRLPPREASP